MIVITKNSTYELDPNNSRYRKLLPIAEAWQPYLGLVAEPVIGNKLLLARDKDHMMITSPIIGVSFDDETDDEL